MSRVFKMPALPDHLEAVDDRNGCRWERVEGTTRFRYLPWPSRSTAWEALVSSLWPLTEVDTTPEPAFEGYSLGRRTTGPNRDYVRDEG